MKKSTLFGASLLTVAAMPVVGYAQTGDASIYNHKAWEDEKVLKLFSAAWDEGRNCPTTEELNGIGMNFIDMEMARSHTRFRNITKDADRDLISDINHDRLLWGNFPAITGREAVSQDEWSYDKLSCLSTSRQSEEWKNSPAATRQLLQRAEPQVREKSFYLSTDSATV